jgi:hypothetical protein
VSLLSFTSLRRDKLQVQVAELVEKTLFDTSATTGMVAKALHIGSLSHGFALSAAIVTCGDSAGT